MAKNCSKWTKWSKMVQSAPNGPKWSEIVKNDPKWSKVDQLDQLVQNNQKWTEWSKMSKIVQSGRSGQNVQKMSKVDQVVKNGPIIIIIIISLICFSGAIFQNIQFVPEFRFLTQSVRIWIPDSSGVPTGIISPTVQVNI